MRIFKLLISPRLISFKNRLTRSQSNRKIKILTFTVAGSLFWFVLFFLTYKVLVYFSSQEMIGDIPCKASSEYRFLIFFLS